MDERQFEQWLKHTNPAEVEEMLDRIDAEKRLMPFIKLMWKVLEPGRELKTGWALDAICEHLEAITHGEIKRLLINVPPGFMKSLTTNVFWPAWEWGPCQRPSTRYISAAYSEHITLRDNRKMLQLVMSQEYRQYWNNFEINPDERSKTKFGNNMTGWKLATSVGGVGVGERGDRFVIDDPNNTKASESEAKLNEALQWFTEVVPTRINDPDESVIMCIMQRVNEMDVSGHILASELGWDHLCIPMEYEEDHPTPSRTTLQFVDPRTEPGELAWPERFSENHLENELKPLLRSWGGEYAEAGQLQQRPSPRGGGLFKTDYIETIGRHELPKNRKQVRGWDLAASKDGRAAFTVGVKMSVANGCYFIEDVVRGQWSPGEVDEQIKNAAARDGESVLQSLPQDPGQAGKAQKAHFAKMLDGYTFKVTTESGSKEDRARPLASQVEAGNVFIVRGNWNQPYLNELGTFPAGKWKDQVDATSRAYAELLQTKKMLIGLPPRMIERHG